VDPFSDAKPFATRRGESIRPLRITFDESPERRPEPEDEYAAILLNELTLVPTLDIAKMVPGGHQWIDITTEPLADRYLVTTRDAKGEPTRWTGIREWQIWTPGRGFARGGPLYQKLALAAAHASTDRDLFVSTDPLLIAERHRFYRANIVRPSEALPLVHLHLRMRKAFAYRRTQVGNFTMDRGMFFLVAVRQRIPSLRPLIWRSATIPPLSERLGRLGNAVLEKCVRCLEARDELALQFFSGDTDPDRRRRRARLAS
jgi:hypothetical protein